MPTWLHLGLILAPKLFPRCTQQARSENKQNVNGSTARAQIWRGLGFLRWDRTPSKINLKNRQKCCQNFANILSGSQRKILKKHPKFKQHYAKYVPKLCQNSAKIGPGPARGTTKQWKITKEPSRGLSLKRGNCFLSFFLVSDSFLGFPLGAKNRTQIETNCAKNWFCEGLALGSYFSSILSEKRCQKQTKLKGNYERFLFEMM